MSCTTRIVSVLAVAMVVTLWGHAASAPEVARSVTLYRDNYGVPHIYGPTDASSVFGYAFA